MDALALKDWNERFDTVIDSGLFHVFNDDDRRRYVEGLAAVVKPGAGRARAEASVTAGDRGCLCTGLES
jgi:cyclopropane fatty-acyl-phospholipid synthase-like methyltransferase